MHQKNINASKKINDHEERREGGKEGRRKGGKEERREGGKDARGERREGRKEGKKEGRIMCAVNTCSLQPPQAACKVLLSC